jgi:uncharacterized repeat protein (TIGR03803 family)
MGQDGNLYGTTQYGGTFGQGTVFKISIAGVFTSLHSFSGSEGANPVAELVVGLDGAFYGTASSGGDYGGGTAFTISSTGTLTSLHSFTVDEGTGLLAPLVLAPGGDFFGTAWFGGPFPTRGGTVFKLTPAGVVSNVYVFASSGSAIDGQYPRAGLVKGTDGQLYGTTWDGGRVGIGTIFRITPSGSLTSLHSFAGVDGSHPEFGVVEGVPGTFYGTTFNSGNLSNGAIYRLIVPTGPIPTMTGISPPSGPSLGGTPVTITGTDFQAGATVTIGGVAASVTSVAPTQILATTGAHAIGAVNIVVTNPDSGVATLAGGFTYTCGSTSPTATVSGASGICAGSSTNLSVALTGTGPWTLNWADGVVQSGISSSPASRSVSPSSTTTYSVSAVTDANCVGSGSGSATVTVNPIPSATITVPAAVCQNASGLAASVPAAGAGATYAWTITNGTITAGAGTNAIVFSSGVASPIQIGVTVTRGGCSNSGSANVSVTPVATATVTGSAAICAGASATIQAALTGVAPWTVTWSDGVVQSGVAASPATRSVTPAASTSYSVTAVTDATGCAGTHSGLADIVVKPAPLALITPNAAQVCPGSTGNIASTVDAGVGATYAWTVTNGTVTSGAGTRQITFTAGAPGSNVVLAVTTTASNGCSSTDTRVWTVLAAPTAALSGPTTACSGQPTNLNVNLAGQPPWNLKWSDGLVQIIPSSPATRVVTLAADASFSLTSLTDGAGCTGSVSGSVSIAVRQAASAVISGGGTVCSGGTATVSAVVTSASPFSARWNDGVIQSGSGSTTLSRVVHPVGTTLYRIDAIFDGTCTSVGTGSALVSVGLEPSAAIVTAPGSVCAGASGAASVPDAGAAASYTWSIRNGTIDGGQGTRAVTFTAGDESPARLTVLVQAGTGCQVSGFWDVIVNRRPPAPALTAPAKAVSGDIGLVASVPGGGSDVFVWTVENGTLTSGQGTNTIGFSAGLPGATTVRVVQKTVAACASEVAVLSIPVSGLSATRIVPVVVSVGGNGGAQFRSELTFTNPGGSNAHVDLTLTPADSLGGGAGSTVGQDIGPGRQLVIPDALAFFAGQGALRAAQTAGAAGGGSVRAVFTNLPAKALVYGGARTTALSGAGRAGLAYPAPAAEDFFAAPVAVYGLRETAAERSNLALENAGTSGAIGLRVTLVSGATNARFVLPDNVFLQPGQWYQIGSVLKAAGFTSGWALVERVSGTDPYYAYGVANDNVTNDGAFLAAVPAVRPASAQVVPSIVETPAFGTELLLVNPGSASATASLNFIESLASPLGNSTGFVTETLKPGEQRFIPDVVEYLRSRGASPGVKGASYAGPLFVRFTAGGAAVDGYVASRTSAPAAGGGGYGVSYAGVALAETASSSAWVFGLQQDAASRSNLGLLNAATNLGTITLRYDVYDGATGTMAGGATVSLFPGQWTQVNTILKNYGLANGYVRVTRTAGTAPWVAYGVLNDGAAPGAGTGDGSFIGMTTTP